MKDMDSNEVNKIGHRPKLQEYTHFYSIWPVKAF